MNVQKLSFIYFQKNKWPAAKPAARQHYKRPPLKALTGSGFRAK